MGDVGVEEALLEATSVVASQTVLPWFVSTFKAAWKSAKGDRGGEDRWEQVAVKLSAQSLQVYEQFRYLCPLAFPLTRMELASIYVPLRLVALQSRQEFEVDKFPAQVFKHGKGKCLVLDAAGMGKTTIGKRIYISALDERIALPFFIDLRRFSSGESLLTMLAKNAGLDLAEVGVLSNFLSTQNCLFIFDGFDEIDDRIRGQCDLEIRRFVDHVKKSKFLLTSRPDNDFSTFSDFERYHIRSLKVEEAYALIRRYGRYGGKPELLIAELEKTESDAVSSFLENPLLTSLLFRAFEYKKIVPLKKNVFYHQVFDSLFQTHDSSKEPGFAREKKCKLHVDDMHRVLRAVASRFHSAGVVEMRQRDFKLAVEGARADWSPDLKFSPADFMRDVISAVPIFVVDGDHVRWSHKSLLDYFIAEFFSADYQGDKAAALRRMVFESTGRRNYNMLTLINEIEPLLFQKECLLVALDELIGDIESVESVLDSRIVGGLRREMAAFFGMHRVVICRDAELDLLTDFHKRGNQVAERAGLDPKKFHARMMSFRTLGVFVLFEHRALLPITICDNGGYRFMSERRNPHEAAQTRLKKAFRLSPGEVKDSIVLMVGTASTVRGRLADLYDCTEVPLGMPSLASLKERRERINREVAESGEARRTYEF